MTTASVTTLPAFQDDLEQTRRFLDCLDPHATTFTFQTFSDNKQRLQESLRQQKVAGIRRPQDPHAHILHGSLEALAERLVEYNHQESGVFVTVNETDGQGRTAAHITRVRAVFVDLDGSPLEPLLEDTLKPHLVVESSQGRFHGYYKVSDCPLEAFGPLQSALALRFNGDSSVKDLPRVMRLPGFCHQKVCKEGTTAGPFMTRIVEAHPERPPYTVAELEAWLVPQLHARHAPPPRAVQEERDLPAWEVERLREALTHLCPDEYALWLEVGMALHSTQSRQAYDLWGEWSARSDKFDPEVLEAKWATFDAQRDDGVTLRTLFHRAREQGWVDQQASRETLAALIAGTDDFDFLTGEMLERIQRADLTMAAQEQLLQQISRQTRTGIRSLKKDLAARIERAAGVEHRSVVEELNRKHAVVRVGKTLVMTEEFDEGLQRRYITLESRQSLLEWYANQTKGGDNPAAIWFNSPRRRQYEGIVFAPGLDVPDKYNLFRGFPIKPRAGDCSRYWYLLKEVICNGNEEQYRYVRRWLAHLFQKPAELPETALVLRGPQGVGKNTLVHYPGRLVGSHYLELSQMNQVTGRFNAHLQDALLVLANEAIWGGDKNAEGPLKAMITDPHTPIEGKGRDIIQMRNYKRLVLCSNNSWVVARDPDDRRFLVLDVSPKHKEDKAFFGALKAQMENGGLEALMHDLLAEDLRGFEPRALPASRAGFDIKLRSAESPLGWLFELLDDGALWDKDSRDLWQQTGDGIPPLDKAGRLTLRKKQLMDMYWQWCKEHNGRYLLAEVPFAKALRDVFPDLQETRPRKPDGGRPRCYVLPPLEQCRRDFERFFKEDSRIWTPEGSAED